MRVLLDTQLLLWATLAPNIDDYLSATAVDLITDPENETLFSVASIWEVAIKTARQRPGFDVEPLVLRRTLLSNDYTELPIAGEHAAAVRHLPPIHKDPFDRLLVAQATVEGIELLTADRTLARYPGPIRFLG